ncbi:DNA polymerase-3 subunit beta [Paenarthrobacter nicotinovorans]|uniref:DNA polymerase-3 subunit beta n=1 Tax=Paenarthrobacter nicotinovorans TaxID=29320 RepID=A0ABT9TKX6_PAENI|nr:DNA polymerase III subunit beta [Paenarthrobacter nicotinovorans]MDQ0102310.1 DNA polymerase-3 subunit beta [Paenarthrobacter nicotinovorans]
MTSVQTITAPAKEWIAALTRLTPAMAGSKPTPILYNCLVHPGDSSISGYDYATSAMTILEESRGQGGGFLVSWRWLLDAIRSTSGKTKAAPVTVSVDDDKVTVSACGYQVHTEAGELEKYPPLPEVLPDASSTLPAAGLRAALRQAGVAASIDETLPVLNGIRVEMTDGAIDLMATDRYRLAYNHVAGEGKGAASFLLPRRAIKAIDRFITRGTVVFGVHEESRKIIIATAATTYTVMAFDGDYPKIRSLFPEEVTGAFEVDRVVLLESARVAAAMNERHQPCLISLFDEGGKVTFDFGVFGPSESPTAAGGNVAGDKEPIKFAMNPHFVIETLTQFSTDKVRISYTSLPKPFLFTGEGVAAGEEEALKHLIMPVRMPS